MPSLKQVFSHPRNSFSASHFLIGYGKCERLHGHNYFVKVQIDYNQSESKSTIDFREINSVIQEAIRVLHHKILIPKDSQEINISSSLDDRNWLVEVREKTYSFPKKDVLILEGIQQTTAESIAIYMNKKLVSWIEKNYPTSVCSLEVSITENLGNEVKFAAKILQKG
ncbi:MAG: 6-pyruvoyl tetrahydropterin synthase family protein [Candidatus Hodarchaeota archaeon]